MFKSVWRKTLAPSSIQHAGMVRAVETDERAHLRYVVSVLLFLLPAFVVASDADQNKHIPFDIPQQRADLALTQFAEQADLTLIFPFDEVRKKTANKLVGEYPKEEAIEILLAGTGLKPKFSSRVVLNIASDDQSEPEGQEMNAIKKTGLRAILAGIFSISAAAQEPGETNEDDLANPAAQDRTIEEIVVTARAKEETIRDIPVAITAIGEERLDLFGLESFTDLEAITPQLDIGRSGFGSGASIAIRGIGSSSGSLGIEQSVAVIIDGAYYPQGRVINEGLFDVSQVAVLKGPQALFFGKNATAGVVAIRTNNPTDEFETSVRVNNEFESDDLTVEAVFSFPVNDKLGLRLALQGSDMDGGYIQNSAGIADEIYTTTDGFTGEQTSFNNPRAFDKWPGEETRYARLTAAGTISDRFSYNVKGSFGRYERASPSGGGELFDCSTLNGVAHRSVPAPVQPPGRPSTLFIPEPLPSVDCTFDGKSGWNNVPPAVAATNPIWNEFGGHLGETYDSYVLTTTLDWTLDNFDVQAIVNFQDQDDIWVGDQDGGAVTSIFVGEHNTFENFSTEVRAVTKFNEPVNYVLGMYYQETELFFDQRVGFGRAQWTGPPGNPEDEFVAYRKISGTDGETRSIYGEVIWDINDQLQLTAGARYIEEDKDSYFYQPYVAPYSFFRIFFRQFEPDDPSTLVLGDQSFDDFVPEVTLRYKANENVTYYAAYKEGFKSGGFSNSSILSNLLRPEINPGNGGFLYREFMFEPETNKGGEVGVKASLFDNSMLASFEIFYYDFKDLQVNFLNSQQFAYVTENAGGSDTTGAEFQFDWATPVDGLNVSGSVGYLESKYTEFESFCFTGQKPSEGCGPLLPGQSETDLRQNLAGNTRPGVSKWSGFFAANYQRPIGGSLEFGATANIQFKSDVALSGADPGATLPAYQTYDANVRIGSRDGKWQLALIAKNLSDKLAFGGAGNAAGTGGNTGTPEGYRGDLAGSAIRPRQIELQFSSRF